MSDEPKKSDAIEIRWQPVAVVSLEKRSKRPRSVMIAIWEFGSPIGFGLMWAWSFLSTSDQRPPIWRYATLGFIAAVTIWAIVEGARSWLSRPRA
jgi:hypothetical protein